MLNLIKKYREPLLYIVFGALSTVINIASYFVCTRYLAIDILSANVIAWILAVAFAFITNKIWVFESKTQGILEFIRELVTFVLARIGTLIIDMALMYLLITQMGLQDLFVKIFIQVIVILLNYVLSKLVIFKE